MFGEAGDGGLEGGFMGGAGICRPVWGRERLRTGV